MFQRYTVLQLFCIYNLRYMYCIFPCSTFCTFTLLLHFLNDFEIVPFTHFFPFYMRCIFTVTSLYFRIFWFLPSSHFCVMKLDCPLTYMFLFHYHGLWCPVCCQGLFRRFALVDSIIWLLSLPVSTNVYTCLNQCFLCNFTPISLHELKRIWTHALSYLFTYWFVASIEHAGNTWSIFSSESGYCLHLLSVSVCNILFAWYVLGL